MQLTPTQPFRAHVCVSTCQQASTALGVLCTIPWFGFVGGGDLVKSQPHNTKRRHGVCGHLGWAAFWALGQLTSHTKLSLSLHFLSLSLTHSTTLSPLPPQHGSRSFSQQNLICCCTRLHHVLGQHTERYNPLTLLALSVPQAERYGQQWCHHPAVH